MNYFDYTDTFASVNWIARKDVVKKFEEQFAQYIGVKHSIATSYGRTALYLGLRSLNVKDSEVIIPVFICTVVRHAVIMAGATPRFADVTYNKLGYNLNDLKNKISSRTKAIVITHFFGRVAPDFEEIITIGKEKNITIIEDCAHALGAEYGGKKVGTFGDFSIFSLTKNTINYGGGFLATNDANLFQKAQDILKNERHSLKKTVIDFPIHLRYGFEQVIDKALFDRVGKSIFKWWLIKLPGVMVSFRNYLITAVKFFSKSKKPLPVAFPEKINEDDALHQRQYPFSLRMSPITASMGSNQLRKIDQLTDKRKNIVNAVASKIHSSRAGLDNNKTNNAYSFIMLKFENNDIFRIISHCRKQGLLLRATWPTHQKLWDEQDTPTVRKIERSILTWTVNPMLTEREIKKFIDIINSIPESRES